MHTILVIEDDESLRDTVGLLLEREGFKPILTGDGRAGLEEALRSKPSLVLVDLKLPGMSGLDICRELRAQKLQTPIIVLSAVGDEIDKVLLLEVGADDYVVKPFGTRELLARIKAVLRRAHGPDAKRPHEFFERGRLRIDFDTYQAFLDGQEVKLSLREFELLSFLVRHPNRVFERTQLLDLVWGRDTYVEPRTVDVHVRRLRTRVERDDRKPELILTVRGVGYKFNDAALDT